MDFETSEIPGSRDFVKDFLEGLNHDNSDPEKTTAYKIADKMEHYEQLTFADLMRGEKLKYLRGDVYELRIPIKKVNYRFLGYPDRTTFYMVHALVKKTLGRTV